MRSALKAVLAAMAAAFLVAALPGWHAHAATPETDWFVTDQGRARLVSGVTSTGQETVPLGLEFELAPHWKIYWRSPGDAGYPPQLDWAGSENLAKAELGWPAPTRFSVLGLETAGYEGHVVLPIEARAEHAGAALLLRATLHYLTCSEICVPYETKLALDLPSGPGAASPHAALIARFAAREPSREQGPDLAVLQATFVPGNKTMLELRAIGDPPLAHPDVFIEGPDGLSFGAPRIMAGATRNETLLRVPVHGLAALRERLPGERLTVTLTDGDRALETAVTPELGPPEADAGDFARILGLALLGGFILNFMPCVLPVLALKLAGIVGARGRARGAARLGFIASAAGVLVSFLVLAAIAIALKEAGLAVGWGMQFQQPLFLIFMMALLTLFAANLWGLFEVPLPQALGRLGATDGGSGLLGSFLTGAFATLLATPCSAPFLGTAIGFALASGAFEIVAVFLALGIGLAAPYLLVAAVPRLVGWLPRPGAWMIGLRRILGLALAATALWLAWVLAAESGLGAALGATALLLAVPLVLLWRHKRSGRGAAVAALIVFAFLVPTIAPQPSVAPEAAGKDAFWQPFDPGAIDGLVGQGKTVFVDVTADWCLTCKLNERVAIDSAAVRDRLAGKSVVAMRADWTRPNDAIVRYLRDFGRYGIPFNAIYGPGLPRGRALPELLTPGTVISALDASRAAAREGG
jgi:suppressor for copper-sensitivity B